MNRARTAGSLALLGTCLAVALALVVQRDPARPIVASFESLAEVLSRSPGLRPLEAAVKGRTLHALLTDSVVVHTRMAGLSGTVSASDVVDRYGVLYATMTDLSLVFGDYRITFPERHTAHVRVTAQLQGNRRTGGGVDEVQELQCTLRRVEGQWRFAEVATVDVLQR